MPIMPRTEDKTKRIAYKILGIPSNMRKRKKNISNSKQE